MAYFTYRVDNTLLSSHTEGIIFRFTKDLADFDEDRLAEWGSLVRGYDEGDDWLRVGGVIGGVACWRYLPTVLRGVSVLSLVEEGPALHLSKDTAVQALGQTDGFDIEASYEALSLISAAPQRCEGSEEREAIETFTMGGADGDDCDEDCEENSEEWDDDGAGLDVPSLEMQYEMFSMDKVEARSKSPEASEGESTQAPLSARDA